MINKEIILNADGTIKKDFSDRAIPQNSNNQVSVNVLIPSTCFTGLSNYAVLLAVSRIIGNSETTLNTLVMSVSKSITIDGVVYVKYTAYLTTDYTDKLGQLKFSPYIQTTATITEDDETSEVISIQQAFTNSNLNVIKSVLPQYDASLEDSTIATTLETQINGKKIYTFIDDATSDGEHYYNLVDGFNPSVDQFKGCLVVSVYNGATTYIMPYSNDGVELLEITSDGVFNKISGVSYADSTYTYTKQKLSYTKAEIDTKESGLQNQIDALNTNKVDKTQKVNGHALSGDITLTKGDIGLGNVANYGVVNQPSLSGDQLYITSKGVYDALQDLNSAITLALSGKADTTDITSLDSRLDAIETLIGDNDGDQDNIINTLKEVISALSGLGEDANILSLINSKASQSDFNTLDGEINGIGGIKDKVDLLSERTNAYMEIKNSLGTIDIAVSDWEANTDANYPYKWELTNGYLEGAVNCIVVYSKDSDTSMLSATTGIDEENGKLIIYASELPSATISIEKIAVFNDLNSYINYSNEIVQQVMQNTGAISDINNVKLPQYVKKELQDSGYYTQVNNYNETGNRVAGLGLAKILGSERKISFANVEEGVITLGHQDITNNTGHSLTFDENGDLKIDGVAVGGGGGHKVIQAPSNAISQVYGTNYYVIDQLEFSNLIDTATGQTPTSYEKGDIIISTDIYSENGTNYIEALYVFDFVDDGTYSVEGDLILSFLMKAKETTNTYYSYTQPINVGGAYSISTNDIDNLGDNRLSMNDYILYIDSNDVVSEIYGVSSVSNNTATLFKLASFGGGGKQLYQHNIIQYTDSSNTVYCAITITNDSNEKIDTNQKLIDFLWNNGYTSPTKALKVNGWALNSNNSAYNRDYVSIYVNSASDTHLSIIAKTPTYAIEINANAINFNDLSDENIIAL